jgi:Mn2+/Fe2+ NRAMP family transporter
MRATATPSFEMNGGYVAMLIGVVGTTIAPWMQFYLQSAVVEKGIKPEHYAHSRLDVIVGCIITDVVAFFIIIACAATIYASGNRQIADAGDAAVALRPLAGQAASLLFAFGLVNASLFATIFKAGLKIETAEQAALALGPLAGRHATWLFAFGLFNASFFAATILPLATAYYVCEAFGWESGIDKKWGEARQFYWLYTGIVAVGAAVVLIPNLPLIKIMLISQVVNGMLLPFILIFMLLLVNNVRIMGKHTNGPVFNAVAWVTTVVMIALTGYLVVDGIRNLAGT